MATADQTENKTKVLVNVYEPLIAIMKHKFDAACLKRDAYLDKALRIEAGMLREEVTTPNSDQAKNFITENLKQLRLKPLNLLLSTETVELINEVCKEKNIPRDSFINRFFLLMIASDTILKALFFFHRGKIEEIEEEYSYAFDYVQSELSDPVREGNLINGLDVIEGYSEESPLYIIRAAFNNLYIIQKDDNIFVSAVYENKYHRTHIGGNNYESIKTDSSKLKKLRTYNYVFDKKCFSILPDEYSFIKTNNMLGFNTYIPDDELPKEETSSPTTLAKNELDKLLAFTKSEKTRTATKKDTNPTEGESQ